MERAFVYGDLLFETMKMVNGQVQYFEKHMRRLLRSMEYLMMNTDGVAAQISETLLPHKNEQTNARVRVVVNRNSQGFYLPTANEVSINVELFPLLDLPPKPLTVCTYRDNHKPCTPLSNLKTGNALIYVLAAIHARTMQCDDALIMNERGYICEATASNIFIREAVQWITPPLSEGCVAGVMREVVVKELKVKEEPLDFDRIRAADEVILTNAIQGKVPVAKIL
jgi:branched-chain amino acid aminotransferase